MTGSHCVFAEVLLLDESLGRRQVTDLRALLNRTLGRIVLLRSKPRRYTAEQIKLYLRRQVEPAESDALAIRHALESIGQLAEDPRFASRFRGYPSYTAVLPKILFLYVIGREPREIAHELNFLATDYGIESVVDIATQIVAERLNAA